MAGNSSCEIGNSWLSRAMKVTSRTLSHLRLDQTYCLLNARGVGVVLELFKAIDVRGEMALDGTYIPLHTDCM